MHACDFMAWRHPASHRICANLLRHPDDPSGPLVAPHVCRFIPLSFYSHSDCFGFRVCSRELLLVVPNQARMPPPPEARIVPQPPRPVLCSTGPHVGSLAAAWRQSPRCPGTQNGARHTAGATYESEHVSERFAISPRSAETACTSQSLPHRPCAHSCRTPCTPVFHLRRAVTADMAPCSQPKSLDSWGTS